MPGVSLPMPLTRRSMTPVGGKAFVKLVVNQFRKFTAVDAGLCHVACEMANTSGY